jgi:uncharacterized protein
MTLLIWTLAVVLVAAGIAGMILPVLPGPPLLFLGLLAAAWAENFAYVGMVTLVALGIMTALAVVADFVAGAFGARRYGASSRAALGAAIGAVVGIFFGLPGILLGPFVGAVVGELTERSDLAAASRAGWGATIGLVLGTAAKLALGFAMIGLFVIVRFISGP